MAKRTKAKSSKDSGADRPTHELARTWLITVINPLLHGFRQEQHWLLRKNWSWRYSTGGFEYLWLAENYVDPAYRDNFHVFCEWYPQAAGAIRTHDSALKELAAECNKTYRSLLESPDLIAALQDGERAAAGQGISLEDARGALRSDQWLPIIIEYLINNVGELPNHYTSARFWNVAGPVIKAVRNLPSLRDQFQTLDHLGAKVLHATQAAETSLAAIRNSFMHDFGLPPVPLASG